jgi:hypothetical protein
VRGAKLRSAARAAHRRGGSLGTGRPLDSMQMQVPPTNGAIHLRPIGQNASNISQGSEAVPKKIGANVSNLSQKNMSSVHQVSSFTPAGALYCRKNAHAIGLM